MPSLPRCLHSLMSFLIVLLTAPVLALPTPRLDRGPLDIFGKPSPIYSSGGYFATSVAVADLNGDGIPDFVVANACTSGWYYYCTNPTAFVSVFIGNGDGTFQPAVTYNAGGYSVVMNTPVISVIIADVNGDGHPDLITATQCQTQGCSNGAVSVLLGNGDGTFQPAVTYNAGGSYFSGQGWGNFGGQWVAAGDLRGTGRPDLILPIACPTPSCDGNPISTVSVLMNNGDGTFQSPVSYSTGAWLADSVGVADVNGDGKLDVVVVDAIGTSGDGNGAISVLLGNGDGSLQAPVTYDTGNLYSNAIAIGDLRRDGKLDVIVGTRFWTWCWDQCGPDEAPISIFLGNGDGTFQPAATMSTGGLFAISIAIADVDGDGTPDLIVAQLCAWSNSGLQCVVDQVPAGPGQVAILLGKGDGTFTPTAIDRTGGMNAQAVAVADLNRDGRPDLVLANQCAYHTKGGCASGGTVGVLLNNFTVGTVTLVKSSLNPAHVHQSVTFTATIISSQAIPDGEVVTFYNGANEIGTGATTNGVATLTTAFSAPGKYTIKASYPGDSWHRASSGKLKQTVKP